MLFPSLTKIVAATAGLTLAGLVSLAPASAAPFHATDMGSSPLVSTVQYGGGYHGGREWGHRRGHHGHCYMQRSVRHTPYGRQVVQRRVCN